MRSKLTLSIEKETIQKAKSLAGKKETTVSAMFSDFIERQSKIDQKLKALAHVSGMIDKNLAAEPREVFGEKSWKKHGW
jgi:hypothetical protein